MIETVSGFSFASVSPRPATLLQNEKLRLEYLGIWEEVVEAADVPALQPHLTQKHLAEAMMVE